MTLTEAAEPATPTGKRLWESDRFQSLYLSDLDMADILAIEQEAAAMERKRLRALIVDGHDPLVHVRYSSGADFWEPLMLLLRDPEPKP